MEAKMCNLTDPNQALFRARPDIRRLIPMSFASPISTDYWDDDDGLARLPANVRADSAGG